MQTNTLEREQTGFRPETRASFAVLAEGYRYPSAAGFDRLRSGLGQLPRNPMRRTLERFVQALERLSLEGREELYTRTLDLAPLVAPYVGYQIWSDTYQRGEFMASLNRQYLELGLDTAGELPDHLAVVLHYLEYSERPLPELLEALEPALKAMHKTLETLESHNPYLHLLSATALAAKGK